MGDAREQPQLPPLPSLLASHTELTRDGGGCPYSPHLCENRPSVSPGSPQCPGPRRGRGGRTRSLCSEPSRRCSPGPSDPAGQAWANRAWPREGQRPRVTQRGQDGPVCHPPPTWGHSAVRTGPSAPHLGSHSAVRTGPSASRPQPGVTQSGQDGSMQPPGPSALKVGIYPSSAHSLPSPRQGCP